MRGKRIDLTIFDYPFVKIFVYLKQNVSIIFFIFLVWVNFRDFHFYGNKILHNFRMIWVIFVSWRRQYNRSIRIQRISFRFLSLSKILCWISRCSLKNFHQNMICFLFRRNTKNTLRWCITHSRIFLFIPYMNLKNISYNWHILTRFFIFNLLKLNFTNKSDWFCH
jgi:hypothetical protein